MRPNPGRLPKDLGQLAEAQAKIDFWNKTYSIGTEVWFCPHLHRRMTKHNRPDKVVFRHWYPLEQRVTLSAAYLMNDQAAAIFIDGVVGAVFLDSVKIRRKEDGKPEGGPGRPKKYGGAFGRGGA